MAEKIKFHLDENVRNAIAQGLKRRGIDVTTTPEQFLKSQLVKHQALSFLNYLAWVE